MRNTATLSFSLMLLCACQSSSPMHPPHLQANPCSEGASPPLEVLETDRAIRRVDVGHLAFPDILRLPDGDLLLAYREGAAHVDATGRVVLQRGDPDGASWGEPYTAVDSALDDRDPSLSILSDGSILLTWFQYATLTRPDGQRQARHQVFAALSRDNGATFEVLGQVTAGPMGVSEDSDEPPGDASEEGDQSSTEVVVAATSSRAIEVDGAVLIPVYEGAPYDPQHADAPRSRVSIYATGDLKEWERRPVAPGTAMDVWLQEPTLLVLDDLWLVHARTAEGDTPFDPGRMAATSSTDGIDWSDWSFFPFIGHAPSLYRMSHGQLLSAFREVSEAYDQVWTSVVVSDDDGRTWSEPVRVHDGGEGDSGYPSLVEADEGVVLMVYYGHDAHAILVSQLRLAPPI